MAIGRSNFPREDGYLFAIGHGVVERDGVLAFGEDRARDAEGATHCFSTIGARFLGCRQRRVGAHASTVSTSYLANDFVAGHDDRVESSCLSNEHGDQVSGVQMEEIAIGHQ